MFSILIKSYFFTGVSCEQEVGRDISDVESHSLILTLLHSLSEYVRNVLKGTLKWGRDVTEIGEISMGLFQMLTMGLIYTQILFILFE